MPTRILLKTTIGSVANDWNVSRFSLLAQFLRALEDSAGAWPERIPTPQQYRDEARRRARRLGDPGEPWKRKTPLAFRPCSLPLSMESALWSSPSRTSSTVMFRFSSKASAAK